MAPALSRGARSSPTVKSLLSIIPSPRPARMRPPVSHVVVVGRRAGPSSATAVAPAPTRRERPRPIHAPTRVAMSAPAAEARMKAPSSNPDATVEEPSASRRRGTTSSTTYRARLTRAMPVAGNTRVRHRWGDGDVSTGGGAPASSLCRPVNWGATARPDSTVRARNAARQPPAETTTPPAATPRTPPPAMVAVNLPTARPRAGSGTWRRMSARLAGTTAAPATPCSSRATIRGRRPGAAAAAAEAEPSRTVPASSSRC